VTMRTTINIEDVIFEELLSLTRARTKTEAVRLALREYVRRKRKEELLGLRDRFAIDDAWVARRAWEIEEQASPDA